MLSEIGLSKFFASSMIIVFDFIFGLASRLHDQLT